MAELSQVILQAAQMVVQANQQNAAFTQRIASFEQERQQHDKKIALEYEMLELRQEEFTLKAQMEQRVAAQGTRKADLQERGVAVREALAASKITGEGGGGDNKKRMEALRRHKMELEKVEEDAALRAAAPLQFQRFSNTEKLNRHRASRVAARDKFLQYGEKPDSPQIKELDNEIAGIDSEDLERAKFKRTTMHEMGQEATLDSAKQYLPGTVKDEEEVKPEEKKTPAAAPAGPPPINLEGESEAHKQDILRKLVHSYVGRDTTWSPENAKMSILGQHATLKASDPAAAHKLRLNILRYLPGTEEERLITAKEMGLVR